MRMIQKQLRTIKESFPAERAVGWGYAWQEIESKLEEGTRGDERVKAIFKSAFEAGVSAGIAFERGLYKAEDGK